MPSCGSLATFIIPSLQHSLVPTIVVGYAVKIQSLVTQRWRKAVRVRSTPLEGHSWAQTLGRGPPTSCSPPRLTCLLPRPPAPLPHTAFSLSVWPETYQFLLATRHPLRLQTFLEGSDWSFLSQWRRSPPQQGEFIWLVGKGRRGRLCRNQAVAVGRWVPQPRGRIPWGQRGGPPGPGGVGKKGRGRRPETTVFDFQMLP